MPIEKVYFPNLNAIRFVAAFLVIISHIEGYKAVFKQPNYFSRLIYLGEFGVILFFVLSGFLITYLLLREKDKTSTISIRKFYIRRILRIWPLYFLIILLSFFILPHFSLFTEPGETLASAYPNIVVQTSLLLFFLPNLLGPVYGVIPGINQLWSIGVEEQFYLFWPFLMKAIQKYKYLLLVIIIGFYTGVRFLLYHIPSLPHQKIIINFWEHFNIDIMAIGGLFAVLYHKESPLLKFIYNKWVQWILLLGIIFCFVTNTIFSETYHNEIFALFFGMLILNFATNPKPIFRMEGKIIYYLGNISYGIYMYHMIAVIFCINLLLKIGWFTNLLLYPVVIGLTILLAGLSYKYFEKPFLRVKDRFTRITSGDSARLYPTKLKPSTE